MRIIKSEMPYDVAAHIALAVDQNFGNIDRFRSTLNQFCHLSHACSRHAGWWDEERNFGELIALIHSEVSEAMEGGRKDAMDDHLPDRTAVAAELADAVIRIGDLAGVLSIPLGDVVIEKMQYNARRADHKRENRSAAGGKQF